MSKETVIVGTPASPATPQSKDLPIPPENPREQLYASLSVYGAIFCLLLTTVIIVYLFYYANAEEQAARESQHRAEFLRDKAETLIANLTSHLRGQQGRPVDVKFAEAISADVTDYYKHLSSETCTVDTSQYLGALLYDIAFLCKTQGLLTDAYQKYEQSFRIFSGLAPNFGQNEDAWIRSFGCLSGEADVALRQGRFADAEEKYRKSLERRAAARGNRSVPDRETDYAQGLVNIGDLDRDMGKLEEARSYVDQGLEVEAEVITKARNGSPANGDLRAINDCTLRLLVFKRTKADILRRLGRLDDANAVIDEVFKDLETLPNEIKKPDTALTHLVKADVLRGMGQFEGASHHYYEAYGIWEAIVQGDEYNLSTQSLLVDSLLGQGDMLLARCSPAVDADSILKKVQEKYGLALAKLNSLHADADAYAHQAKVGLAETKLGEVALAEGAIHVTTGDVGKARECFTDGLMLFLKSEGIYQSWSRGEEHGFEASSALAAVLCNEGDAYMRLNRFDDANIVYHRSLELREQLVRGSPENLERRLERKEQRQSR